MGVVEPNPARGSGMNTMCPVQRCLCQLVIQVETTCYRGGVYARRNSCYRWARQRPALYI
jgi:hypothetical protein